MKVSRPSPAMVVALVALFVALGGTGYAVTAVPRNSVGSAQLRNRGVKESDLGNRAVVTGKLADQAVTREKLAPGAVSGDRVAPDALGGAQIDESTLGRVPSAAEAAHATAADRAALADKVAQAERALRADSADHADRAALADSATRADRAAVVDKIPGVVVKQQRYSIANGHAGGVVVDCGEGSEALGGGFLSDNTSDIPLVYASFPVPNGWGLVLVDSDGTNTSPGITGIAYANCVPASGA
jgi:hypothetical protein